MGLDIVPANLAMKPLAYSCTILEALHQAFIMTFSFYS